MHKCLMIFGTRPEIIKLGPVYRALEARDDVVVHTCWTGQHIELADGLLELFGIDIDHTADGVMGQASLAEKTGRMMQVLGGILDNDRYDSVIVQGDTVSAMAGAIAAFLHRVPVAHVEAGLRTNNINSPWPEEFSRRVITVAGSKHFAPTAAARTNLLNDGVAPSDVYVTGNTVVDALQFVRKKVANGFTPHCRQLLDLPADKKLILVTGHRRENIGDPLRQVLQALLELADDGDKHLVFPVHLNPKVKTEVEAKLGGHPAIQLLPPLRYPDFVYLLERAWMVITDSGGIQEEAPSFNLPIVITRDTTERPEVIKAGFGRLVGCDADLIVRWTRLLTAGKEPTRPMFESPFGDGFAGQKIAGHLVGERARVLDSIVESQIALF